MIIQTKRHGRTARDSRNLMAHLRKQEHQISRVVAIGNTPLSNADHAVAYMEAMRDGSNATVAFHHISINPSVRLDDNQRDETVRRIMSGLGAEDHPFVLWEHAEKPRNGADVDQHFHLVLGHVGHDGKAIDDSNSYARLEAVARTIELDFGHALTPSRRTASVSFHLIEMGRADVAQHLPVLDEKPLSSMTSGGRAAADRQGVDLPAAQAGIKAAWAASDSPQAFTRAIVEMGFSVVPGRKEGVFVVSVGAVEIGALDRILKMKRRDVSERMKGHENDSKTHRPTGPHAGPEGDLPRDPVDPSNGPTADAAPDAFGTASGGRCQPDRKVAGHPGSDPVGPTASARKPRGLACESRSAVETYKLNASLKGLHLSSDAQSIIADIRVRSIARRRPQATSTILNQQLSHSSRLDRVWRFAFDVRSAINDIRLRIRFGKAERHSEPALPVLERDQEIGIRAFISRIQKFKTPTLDDDYSSPGMRM